MRLILVSETQSNTEKEIHDLEMRWVPCSKQLPEKEGCYLTTTMYGEVYCDYWSGEYFDRSEMVIAWMPLPAPYTWKEEK